MIVIVLGISKVLYYSMKSGIILSTYLKAFFVRYSSAYKMSDSDQKVNRNI